jgi:hypothetical protein
MDGAGVGFHTKVYSGQMFRNSGHHSKWRARNRLCKPTTIVWLVNCSWGGFGGSQFGQDAVNYATFNKIVW